MTPALSIAVNVFRWAMTILAAVGALGAAWAADADHARLAVRLAALFAAALPAAVYAPRYVAVIGQGSRVTLTVLAVVAVLLLLLLLGASFPRPFFLLLRGLFGTFHQS